MTSATPTLLNNSVIMIYKLVVISLEIISGPSCDLQKGLIKLGTVFDLANLCKIIDGATFEKVWLL